MPFVIESFPFSDFPNTGTGGHEIDDSKATVSLQTADPHFPQPHVSD
jgi:hypothetical protein